MFSKPPILHFLPPVTILHSLIVFSNVWSKTEIKFCFFPILQRLSVHFNIKSKLLTMVKRGSFLIWPLPLMSYYYYTRSFSHKDFWTFVLFLLLRLFYFTFILMCISFKIQLNNLLLQKIILNPYAPSGVGTPSMHSIYHTLLYYFFAYCLFHGWLSNFTDPDLYRKYVFLITIPVHSEIKISRNNIELYYMQYALVFTILYYSISFFLILVSIYWINFMTHSLKLLQ